MMSTLSLLQYNNYYNRIVKKELTIEAYQAYLVRYNGQLQDDNANTSIINDVNFVDGNFVDTTQVVNWGGDIPDYLLVTEGIYIKSRWFVIDSQKTRGGQLLLRLHRDLVVDYYSQLMSPNTSIFVEKAHIPPTNDLIFNKEQMSYNRIKVSETLLPDSTKCPWIVLYGARKNGENAATSFKSIAQLDFNVIKITEEEYSALTSLVNTRIYNTPSHTAIYVRQLGAASGNRTEFIIETGGTVIQQAQTQDVTSGSTWNRKGDSLVKMDLELFADDILQDVVATAPSYIKECNPVAYNDILNNTNTILEYDAGSEGIKRFTIHIALQGTDKDIKPNSYSGRLESALGLVADEYDDFLEVTYGNNRNIQVQWDIPWITFILDELNVWDGNGAEVEIRAQRVHPYDAPYDIFCLPLSNDLYLKRPNGRIIKSDSYVNMAIAMQLVSDYAGVGQIYDAQILPYCPIEAYTVETDSPGRRILSYSSNTTVFEIISTTPSSGSEYERLGIIYAPNRTSFNIKNLLPSPINILDYKLESECDIYRLVAPNFSSAFEFNAAKNGGIHSITAVCTYRPFSPYIKLYPDFSRLYGDNFNDARGLICGGDYSLPILTDQWKTYELSNKNYQASFDRQIQNLEVNNAIQREREAWGIGAGIFSGAASGATVGSVAGPAGAVAGSILGGALSSVGGLADRELNERARAEAINYAKDQFGYMLGNIQALPEMLSRTSAYNLDNKYFPFLEYYTCTDVEKQALKDKIRFNGMTVMTIGTMAYYKNNYNGSDPMYFKGKLIRLADFDADSHVLNALALEIDKGVFI